jgi:hypothetical protein
VTDLKYYAGIVEAFRSPDELESVRKYEHCPELDVFMIDDEYVTREVFEAKARELGHLL